ncbi:8072_t:CDS:1, partial [Racocetra fulgida]
KSQNNLTNSLSTFPLVQLSDSSNHIDDENRTEKLEKRISVLELFLRDYVIEAQQLDKIHKNLEDAKDK